MPRRSVVARRHDLNYRWRRFQGYMLGLAEFALSAMLACELRFDGTLPGLYLRPMVLALCIWGVAKSASFVLCGVSWVHWRHTSAHDAVRIVLADSLGSMLGGLAIYILLE